MNASRTIKTFLVALFASCFWLPAASALQTHSDAEPDFDLQDLDPGIQRVDEARLDSVMAAYEADDSLQRDRPEWEPEAIEFRPRPERSGPNPILDAVASFFRALGPLIGYALAVLVAAAILYVLYIVFGESLSLRGRQKEKQTAPDVSIVPDLRPERGRATALLEDADALAAEGRFAEAVHLLLFRSIDDIQEKHSGVVGRSLTSREIGALGILPTSVRDALSPIIRIVERSFFGGRDVDETGWKEARASYETFAFGGAWG